MTLAELEKRVAALEKAIAEIQCKLNPPPSEQRHWWRDDAGAFANDPVFDEIVRLGREYRESLHPDRQKKKKKAPKKNARSRHRSTDDRPAKGR
jgi:hypothetical protein